MTSPDTPTSNDSRLENFFETIGLEKKTPLERLAIAVGIGALFLLSPHLGHAQEQKVASEGQEVPLQLASQINTTRGRIVQKAQIGALGRYLVATSYKTCYRPAVKDKQMPADFCFSYEKPTAGVVEATGGVVIPSATL